LRAVTPPVPGDEFISRQQLLDAAEAVDDGYEDPVGATNPAYAGRWLAGFAPVGNTELVVIVQQKREEWSDALGMWFWLSVVCAALSAAGVAAYRYRRSWTRIPQEPVGPTPQTAPTVPLVDAPIRAP
jgi:hypothetical protein